MKFVIDSNRVFAALLKDSTIRGILFDETFEFIAPEYIYTEINRYKETIKKKIGITNEEYEILMALIFEHITIIPLDLYKEFITTCKDEISDQKDVPYLAVCLASKAPGIWTHDPHFREQNKIKIFTNIDMLKMMKP